jgi:outer membrane protein OmpA-like peptidoglycan-associated protein
MKYKILATSLVCALGAHGAFAQSASDDPNKASSGSTTQSSQSSQSQTSQTPQTPQATNKTESGEVQNVQSVDVLFDTASAQLKPGADAKLKELADWANCNTKGALILEGHADPRGSQAFNMELSAKRAAAVRQKLVEMGARSDRIVISVYGKNGPQRENYQADRRVTIRPAETPVEASEISAMR